MKRVRVFKRVAFTLAEVLITLGIIGIVAEVTIPGVLQDFREQAYLSGFKKMYTVLYQAYNLAITENDTADKWPAASKEQIFHDAVAKNLSYVQRCTYATGCFPNVMYKTYKGYDLGNFHNSTSYPNKYRLKDGACMAVNISNAGSIIIDINGDKGPNKSGYDLFFLGLSKTLDGYGKGTMSRLYCSKDAGVSDWSDGAGCSLWLIRHWNMDYLNRELTNAEWSN